MDPEAVRGATSSGSASGSAPRSRSCAAIKYVDADDLPALAEAGIELVGENRAQELLAKQERHRDLFTWDFIGALQSRKLKDIAPNVRLIHSIASESALRRLEANPAREVLIQVNVAGEGSKEGIDPDGARRLHRALPIARDRTGDHAAVRREPRGQPAPLRAAGRAGRRARPPALSMGTSQDYEVAVEEGATIVRLGSVLYEGA